MDGARGKGAAPSENRSLQILTHRAEVRETSEEGPGSRSIVLELALVLRLTLTLALLPDLMQELTMEMAGALELTPVFELERVLVLQLAPAELYG